LGLIYLLLYYQTLGLVDIWCMIFHLVDLRNFSICHRINFLNLWCRWLL